MSELSFLIELLLNHELPAATKHLVAERIKEVEGKLTAGAGTHGTTVQWKPEGSKQYTPTQILPQQAASTLALMAKHGDIQPMPAPPEMPPVEPVTQIAHTPQAAAAMNSRNAAIAASIAGKTDKVTGRPKKW